jgi:hypothetical protein
MKCLRRYGSTFFEKAASPNATTVCGKIKNIKNTIKSIAYANGDSVCPECFNKKYFGKREMKYRRGFELYGKKDQKQKTFK